MFPIMLTGIDKRNDGEALMENDATAHTGGVLKRS
jgi:hypothetical protein